MSLFRTVEVWSEKVEVTSTYFKDCLCVGSLFEGDIKVQQLVAGTRDGKITTFWFEPPHSYNDSCKYPRSNYTQLDVNQNVLQLFTARTSNRSFKHNLIVLTNIGFQIIELRLSIESNLWEMFSIINKRLSESPFNMIKGPFGLDNTSACYDRLCVQTVSRKLYFFDEDSLILSIALDYLLPCVFIYIKNTDCFLFGSFSKSIDFYSYANFAENAHTISSCRKDAKAVYANKNEEFAFRNTSLSFGEPIFSMGCVEIDPGDFELPSISTAVVLGRRSFAIITHSRTVRATRNLDFPPLLLKVFSGHVRTNDDSKSAIDMTISDYILEVKFIILTQDSHLLIFKDAELLWLTQLLRLPTDFSLPSIPVSLDSKLKQANLIKNNPIFPCFWKDGPSGMFSTITQDGWTDILYLGLDPVKHIPLADNMRAVTNLNETRTFDIENKIKEVEENIIFNKRTLLPKNKPSQGVRLEFKVICGHHDKPIDINCHDFLACIEISLLISAVLDISILKTIQIFIYSPAPLIIKPSLLSMQSRHDICHSLDLKFKTCTFKVYCYVNNEEMLDFGLISNVIHFIVMHKSVETLGEFDASTTFLHYHLDLPITIFFRTRQVSLKEVVGKTSISVELRHSELSLDTIFEKGTASGFLAPKGEVVKLEFWNLYSNEKKRPTLFVYRDEKAIHICTNSIGWTLIILQRIVSNIEEIAGERGIDTNDHSLLNIYECNHKSVAGFNGEDSIFEELSKALCEHGDACSHIAALSSSISLKTTLLRTFQHCLVARAQNHMLYPLREVNTLFTSAINELIHMGVSVESAFHEQLKAGFRVINLFSLFLYIRMRSISTKMHPSSFRLLYPCTWDTILPYMNLFVLRKGLFAFHPSSNRFALEECNSSESILRLEEYLEIILACVINKKDLRKARPNFLEKTNHFGPLLQLLCDLS